MTTARNLLVGIGLSGSLVGAALVAPTATAGAHLPLPAVLSGHAVNTGRQAAASRGAVVARRAPAAAPRSSAARRGPTAMVASMRPLSIGQRMSLVPADRPGRTVDRMLSGNWSGLVGTGAAGDIQGVAGEWTVPAVRHQTRAAQYSSTWVGVGGYDTPDLIQTGTTENTKSARSAPYSAWFEMLPAPAITIHRGNSGAAARVRPGDKMVGLVLATRPGHWIIYLRDKTQHWFFDHAFGYSSAADAADWIQEAPQVDGRQTTIADFGKVAFKETAVYVDGANGMGLYSTSMGPGSEIALVQRSRLRAVPTAPRPRNGSADGQHFTIHYR